MATNRVALGRKFDPWRPGIDPAQRYAPRGGHSDAKAEQMLIIFCAGVVSHLDSFDYKPEFCQHHGKTPPNAPKVTFQGPTGDLAKPFREFKPRGQTGKMVSDLYPNLVEMADNMGFLRSLQAPNAALIQTSAAGSQQSRGEKSGENPATIQLVMDQDQEHVLKKMLG